jgi:hypothetical protein
MSRRRSRELPSFGATAAFALSVVAGCATERPAPPLEAPTAALLAVRGGSSFIPGGRPLEVVVIRDRHFSGGGLTFVDEDLRRLQREHRRLVGELVARGFRLMGAEWRNGPLPEDDVAADHRRAVREAIEEHDDLDRWSIYQPIRYAVELEGELVVTGVEDAELYDADVAALDRLFVIARAARDVDGAPRAALDAAAKERFRIRGEMMSRIDPRGVAAARNLVAAMEERGERRAILLIGAAHVPSASRELAALDVPHHVFTAPSFERRSRPGSFDER